MNLIKSAILIDNNELDNFVNQKLLENCGEESYLIFV